MLPDEKLTNGELKDAWKDESILQNAEIDEETWQTYQKVFEKDTTFGERLGNFIRAENKAGRQAKIIKDFLLVFVPYGRTISNATELAQEIISDKSQPKTDSNMNWIINRLQERSTWRGLIAAATAVGVGWSPEQAKAIVGVGVALFTAIEVFLKEPQSKDAK